MIHVPGELATRQHGRRYIRHTRPRRPLAVTACCSRARSSMGEGVFAPVGPLPRSILPLQALTEA
jgi:hypothetical protein